MAKKGRIYVDSVQLHHDIIASQAPGGEGIFPAGLSIDAMLEGTLLLLPKKFEHTIHTAVCSCIQAMAMIIMSQRVNTWSCTSSWYPGKVLELAGAITGHSSSYSSERNCVVFPPCCRLPRCRLPCGSSSDCTFAPETEAAAGSQAPKRGAPIHGITFHRARPASAIHLPQLTR